MRVSKNQSAAVITLFSLLLFFLPELANAQFSLNPVDWITSGVAGAVTGITASAIGWTVQVINSIIAAIVGVLIGFVSYVIEVFLYLNTHVTESLTVKSGFKIAVSIANLGFVAAIIVIAIATILRSQTYGIKKILWKLVVAALLVNFSLVIAGVIINFADGLALYFINAVNPAGNNFSNYTGFVSGLAGAFAPHRAFIFNAGGTVNFADPAVNELRGAAAAGQTLAAVFTPLFNLFFVSLFLFLILLTLTALVVMLIIRYVYISFLLILMPFAWLLWIFPYFQSNWSKWWHNFLRWTFFAPIVMFFLFLAIQTAGAMARKTADNPLAVFQGTGFNSTASSPIIAGIQNFFGGFANQTIGTILQMIVVLALALGGLFMANSLSIIGAKTFYGAAQSVGRGALGIMGRGAARVTTRPIRGEGGRKLTEKLQQVGAGGGFFARTLTAPVRQAGRGLEAVGVAGGAGQVNDAESRLRKMTDDQLANGMTTFTAPERMKALEILMKHGTLDKMKDKGGVDRYLDEAQFNRYSQGKLFGDLNKTILSDNTMREAAKEIEKVGLDAKMKDEKGLLGKPGEIVRAADLLDKASQNFVRTISKSDIAKAQSNDFFSGKDFMGIGEEAMKALRNGFSYGLALEAPTLVPGIITKLKSEQLTKFSKLYEHSLTQLPLDFPDAAKRREAFEKALGANAMGFIAETPTPTETPPQNPPPLGPTPKT